MILLGTRFGQLIVIEAWKVLDHWEWTRKGMDRLQLPVGENLAETHSARFRQKRIISCNHSCQKSMIISIISSKVKWYKNLNSSCTYSFARFEYWLRTCFVKIPLSTLEPFMVSKPNSKPSQFKFLIGLLHHLGEMPETSVQIPFSVKRILEQWKASKQLIIWNIISTCLRHTRCLWVSVCI